MGKKTEGLDQLEIDEVAKAKIKLMKQLILDPFSYSPKMARFVLDKNGIPLDGEIVV